MAFSRRTASVVIYDGADEQRLSQLHERALMARRKHTEALAVAGVSVRRVGDEPAHLGLAEAAAEAEAEFDAFVDEAAERAEEIVVQAIGRVAFRDLRVAHPPRKVDGPDGSKLTHPEDEGYEVDTESFARALLMWRDPEDESHRTILKPDLAPSALARLLDNELADGDFLKVWVTAWALNTEVAVDPKALRFSVPLRATDAS